MQQRSNRGSGEPAWVNASNQCALLIRDPICGKHEGQRSFAPRQQAGQMTAADQGCINAEKTLAKTAPSTEDPEETNTLFSRLFTTRAWEPWEALMDIQGSGNQPFSWPLKSYTLVQPITGCDCDQYRLLIW